MEEREEGPLSLKCFKPTNAQTDIFNTFLKILVKFYGSNIVNEILLIGVAFR